MHAKEVCTKNPVLDYFDNLIRPKKLETKDIVIDEKNL